MRTFCTQISGLFAVISGFKASASAVRIADVRTPQFLLSPIKSNHFDTSDQASLMASAAHIPWLGSHFIGFISGFWLEGKLFKFATYTGARKYLKINDQQVELIFKGPKTELRILAQQAPGTALMSPLSGEMKGKIQESLQAVLRVELLENGQRIFEGTGRNAGLEVAGEVSVLL